MAINIDNIKFASPFKRSFASSIDMFATLLLRMFALQILGEFWIKNVIANFMLEFKEHFGTEFIKGNQEHMSFLVHHSAFMQILSLYIIIILVGAFYHIYFNSSSWQATPGKRIMNIIMIKEDGKKVNFSLAFSHYFLALLPCIYLIYILIFVVMNKMTFFHAIMATGANMVFGIIFIAWVQISYFTKKKSTMYDLICKTIFIEGRSSTKYPWRNA